MDRRIFLMLIGGLTLTGFAEEHCHQHEQNAPYVTVYTDVRVYGEQVYEADDSGEEIFDLKTHAHVGIEFSPIDNLFIRSSLKLEQKHSHDHDGGGAAPDGKDVYFENHILKFEELKLVYAPGAWEVFGGKFNPTVGLDQHDIPGWYGYEIEEEYSILGRLGAGAAYTADAGTFGSHRLEVSGFCRDTTVLNQTVINSGGEPDRKEEGGVANTHDFSSWAVSLSGDPLYAALGDTLHQLSYVLAYARQDAGYDAEADHADEERGVIGGVYTATLTENLQLKGVGEFKNIRNNHTHGDDDLRISTAGLELSWQGWEFGGSYSVLDHTEEPDGEHIQGSLGYVWPCGFGISGGWKLSEEEGEQQKSIGLMLSYHGHF
ncbi:hypothetical protein [Tichowtungia aerotolerans]|uniref:Porin n=1 Tax=Tichowtungia aerotolerans TaxID=2697043 RepID=A0A6P1MB52_9BACT|nr:hypothetical protein [Tichowtungia aerotolerans]QHI68345.1 hypothetical protein GT409_02360 [Tichowtungia aerotolerans]